MAAVSSGPVWRPLHPVGTARLEAARLQAHTAAQWLARAARGYVPPQPDDAHTNLGWDDALGGFVTHRFGNRLRLAFRISDLTLQLRDGGDAAIAKVALAGRTDAQIRQWLAEQLADHDLDPRKLDAAAPYKMPPHPIAGGEPYDANDAEALTDLSAWFGNAAISLGRVEQTMRVRRLDASPVRCWPHHFDLATLIVVPTRKPGVTGYVGAGLSPGDGYYNEPYFYVSVYPAPDQAALPQLPDIAHWHTHDFTAAVATSSTISAARDPEADTDAVLSAAIDAALRMLR